MKPPPFSLGTPPSAAGRRAVELARTFVADVALPMVAELERTRPDTAFALEPDGRLADDVRALKRRMQQASAEAGLYCAHLPESLGGLGLSLVDCFYVQEEVYRHGLRGVQWMLAWTDGPSPLVAHWGQASRRNHLDDFLAGNIDVAFALTEPRAGSDALALQTSARREGEDWIVNGVKHLITGAPFAQLAQVLARVEGAGRKELTCFLIPLDAPGVERGPVQQTLMADGQTGTLRFRDVRLPADALVGTEGDGLAVALLWINWARTRRGGMCSGLAWHCLDRSVRYGHGRHAFGGPIDGLGPVAGMLSEMYMDWQAMRALSLELLARLDAAELFTARVTPAMRRDVSVLKAWNDDALLRVADRAIQVHGGRGLLTETGLERIYRVARNLRIPAGTSEIQRQTIAESLAAEEPSPIDP